MKQIASTGAFSKFRNTFIGDRKFYTTVFMLVLPLIVQNAISNFVNLLDNIMIGQVGTPQMSGVAIANQLIFVFNLTIFGGLSGAGIFGAQFFGAEDHDGLRYTVRFKLWTIAVTLAVAIALFLTSGDQLISLYLTGEGDAAERAAMLEYGRSYLRIMLWGLLPFTLSQAYGGTLREMGETMLPMKASLAGVVSNLCLNYILIYGKLGFPALGVDGAAIATVVSRFVELAIIIVYAHRHPGRFRFVEGLYRSIRIPKGLAFNIFKKGIPLLVNELFWSLGMTTLMQIFSTRGLNVVAAINISNTITNLFNVFIFSMGSAVAVMVGQALGANDIPRAKQTAWRLMFFNVCICIVVGGALAVTSPFIPYIYNTTDDVRMLATRFMLTCAMYMGFNAVTNCVYFTIRSGGKTFITFLFDSVYTWVVFVPVTYVLARFTSLDISILYPICYSTDIIKFIIGIIIIKGGNWAQNIVSDTTSNVCNECVEPNADAL
ncbi:MATE family efflux transporter [Clostridium thermosuccinogenes]|uniref:MATE family efflux transporter n=1 Tax=Clostridium thermosuccinogenes TaxID=84032 RepID=UPI000CCC8433|nr:MATE family efflux transporter [Pseudoclostridium thermosuccinogenes]PNT92113.1 MATE family efflux transporter [Pseudoclostridium thermosuccinogenes]